MCDDLCSHPDNGKQRVLTVHHLDMDKSNCNWWNLAALCQGCHLHIQAKVDFEQYWMLEHSAWLRPFVLGYDLHQKTGMSVVNVGLQPYDVYIGRAHRRHGDGKTSIWANQYIIGKDGDRSEVLQKYSVWLDFVVVAYPDKYKIVDFLGVRAGCFCKPLGCHGDVIGAKLLEMSMVIRK